MFEKLIYAILKFFGLTKDEEEVKKDATIYQIKPLMKHIIKRKELIEI